MSEKCLAIIPARSGSKRIPGKNIKLFGGKPIIEYSIKAALESKLFEDVIVSTDSAEIAEISNKLGANTPYIRDPKLADDFSSSDQVVVDAIDRLALSGRTFSLVACIYPTAPFLTAKQLVDGLNALVSSGSDFMMAVEKIAFPISRTYSLNQNNELEIRSMQDYFRRTQDFQNNFRDAGIFYWGTPLSWKRNAEGILEPRAFLELPWYQAIDLDTPDDWEKAEVVYRALMILRDGINEVDSRS